MRAPSDKTLDVGETTPSFISSTEFTKLRRHRRQENLGGIISNEIILHEMVAFLRRAFPNGGSALLDLGAGTQPYSGIYEPLFRECRSTDVEHSPHDTSSVDVIAPAESLPFADDGFDCVICTEVLEHCADPWAAASEIRRVLKPGGWAFITTPFLRPLHEPPHDYHRFTPWGLEEMMRRSGLELHSITPRGDYLAVTLMTLLLPISKGWLLISRMLGLRCYRATNPLVWLAVVAPQRLYFALWKAGRRRRGLRSMLRRLEYYTLGYVTVVRAPA